MVTSKNLILKYNFLIYCHYWYEKYQCIEKKVSCWNKCSVFRSNIETIWCMFHEKHFHCPVWTYLHRFDLHIIIRWPKNVRRVNKICLHCGHFIHCYILLNLYYFLAVHDSLWLLVTLILTTEHENKSSYFVFACLNLI